MALRLTAQRGAGRVPCPASVDAAIGLGSNMGDRMVHLRGAVAGLGGLGRIVSVSPVYETAPIGGVAQGRYLNAVVLLATGAAPRPLLDALLGLERAAGRERRVRWGPRTLDLDVLLYGGVVVHAGGLRVPHPRMLERRFVLEPLLVAWPGAPLPGGAEPAPALAAVRGQEIEPFETEGWPATASALSYNVGDVQGESGASMARTQDEGAPGVRRGRGHSQRRSWPS